MAVVEVGEYAGESSYYWGVRVKSRCVGKVFADTPAFLRKFNSCEGVFAYIIKVVLLRRNSLYRSSQEQFSRARRAQRKFRADSRRNFGTIWLKVIVCSVPSFL